MKSDIDVLLNNIIYYINIAENPWPLIKEFDELTLSYDDVGMHIVPFLKQIEEMGFKGIENKDANVFFDNGEILKYFTQRYFHCVKENGYYKSTKLSFFNNWFCAECIDWFDIAECERYTMINELTCTTCSSKHIHYSTKIQQAKVDGKPAADVLEKITRQALKPVRNNVLHEQKSAIL